MKKTIEFAKEILAETEDNRNALASTLFEVVREAVNEGHPISLRVDMCGISVTHGAIYLGPILCRTTDDLASALRATVAYVEKEVCHVKVVS